MSAEDAVQLVQGAGIDASAAQVESVAATSSTVAVVLFGQANGLYTADGYIVNRDTDTVEREVSAYATYADGRITVRDVGYPNAFASGPATAGAPCLACLLFGQLVEKALDALFCADPVTCGIGAFAAGEAADQICEREDCPTADQPGIQPGYPQCLFTSCDFEVNVDNGTLGRHLVELDSSVRWNYPPLSTGQWPDGTRATFWGDSYSVPSNQFSDMALDYTWVHNTTDPAFVNCATTIDYNIFARWSDGWEQDSPAFPANKLTKGKSCPGFQTV